MKKNNNSGERILDIILFMVRSIFKFENKFLTNREYIENIGTLYKGSIKESNEEFRFKERFRWKHQLAFSYALESMGR